jgi:hypothetical protein
MKAEVTYGREFLHIEKIDIISKGFYLFYRSRSITTYPMGSLYTIPSKLER